MYIYSFFYDSLVPIRPLNHFWVVRARLRFIGPSCLPLLFGPPLALVCEADGDWCWLVASDGD